MFMPAPTPHQCALLLLLLAAALINDLRTWRISNFTVAVGAVAGILLNCTTDGLEGMALSLLATALPFLMLLPLFALRMLGAGDIKLLCAIGAIMGLPFILYATALSFISGGAISLILILARGNFKQRARYLGIYLKSCFLTLSFTPYSCFRDKDDGSKFHFTIAIAAGCILQVAVMLSSSPS